MPDTPTMVNVYELDENGIEQLVYREANEEELASLAAIADEALSIARAVKAAEIRAELAATDVWVIRAMEDGAPLSDARAGYREQLRGLLLDVATAVDPASIEIPDPPVWTPPTS